MEDKLIRTSVENYEEFNRNSGKIEKRKRTIYKMPKQVFWFFIILGLIVGAMFYDITTDSKPEIIEDGFILIQEAHLSELKSDILSLESQNSRLIGIIEDFVKEEETKAGFCKRKPYDIFCITEPTNPV